MSKKSNGIVATALALTLGLGGGAAAGVAITNNISNQRVEQAKQDAYDKGFQEGGKISIGYTEEDLQDAKDEVRQEERQKAQERENAIKKQNEAEKEQLRQELEAEKEAEKEQARQEGYEQGKSEIVEEDFLDLSQLQGCAQVEKRPLNETYVFFVTHDINRTLESSKIYLYNRNDKSLIKLVEGSELVFFVEFENCIIFEVQPGEQEIYRLKRMDKESHEVTELDIEELSTLLNDWNVKTGKDYMIFDSSSDKILVSSDGTVSKLQLEEYNPWIEFDNGFLCYSGNLEDGNYKFYNIAEKSLKEINGNIDVTYGSLVVQEMSGCRTGVDTFLSMASDEVLEIYSFNSENLKLSKVIDGLDMFASVEYVPTKSTSRLFISRGDPGNFWAKSIDTSGNVKDLFKEEIGDNDVFDIIPTDEKLLIVLQDESLKTNKIIVANNETLDVEKVINLSEFFTNFVDLKENGFGFFLCSDEGEEKFAYFDSEFNEIAVVECSFLGYSYDLEVKHDELIIKTFEGDVVYSFDYVTHTITLKSIKF